MDKPKFYLARHVSTRFGRVELVEQHGSTGSSRRAVETWHDEPSVISAIHESLGELFCTNLTPCHVVYWDAQARLWSISFASRPCLCGSEWSTAFCNSFHLAYFVWTPSLTSCNKWHVQCMLWCPILQLLSVWLTVKVACRLWGVNVMTRCKKVKDFYTMVNFCQQQCPLLVYWDAQWDGWYFTIFRFCFTIFMFCFYWFFCINIRVLTILAASIDGFLLLWQPATS